jgi:hypothetical protein
MSSLRALTLVGALATSATAHGIVQGIVAGGQWHSGYNPDMQYEDSPPAVAGWTVERNDLGLVGPTAYNTVDIACNENARAGQASIPVAAGSGIELQWTEWPDDHKGPVLDYLAKCPGRCEDVEDLLNLEWFKIDELGYINGEAPGYWASDELQKNNNSWTTAIPSSIAPGNYVLRHEIISLHSANRKNGAQNYPQCINLKISGDGTKVYDGVPATELYKPDDAGIRFNIYWDLTSYPIPGPDVISDAGGNGGASSSSAPPSVSASASAIPSSMFVDPIWSSSVPIASSSVTSSMTILSISSGYAPVASSEVTGSMTILPIFSSSALVPSSSVTGSMTTLPISSGWPSYLPTPTGYFPSGTGYYPTGTGYFPSGTGYYPTATGYYPTGTGWYPSGTGHFSTFPTIPMPSSALSGASSIIVDPVASNTPCPTGRKHAREFKGH